MSAYDAVDGSTTGIEMCHIVRSYEEPPMSLVGTKQSFIDRNRNDRFRVLSGSSERQYLLLGVEQTLTPAASHDEF
jgi:hypothetical protein